MRKIVDSGFVKTCDELVNSHDDPETAAAKENINVRAAFIHVIGDFLQSLGVFIAALVIYFKPAWVIIDPICTFVFSVLVLFTTVKILQDTMRVLMEGEHFYDRELQTGLSMNFFLLRRDFVKLEPSCCKKQQKSSNQETGLGNRGYLKFLMIPYFLFFYVN